MKLVELAQSYTIEGRSPSGERGLKLLGHEHRLVGRRRSPSGERGLKFHGAIHHVAVLGRSPSGERGLKSPAPDI